MKHSRFSLRTYFAFFCLFTLTLALAGCKSKSITTDEVGSTECPVQSPSDEIAHFWHAWLADCINDKTISVTWNRKDAKTDFLNLATQRITNALGNSCIKNGVGIDSLAWGPQFQMANQGSVLNDYVSTNLMYCVKSLRPGTTVEYTVGISGTNMISLYDWFSEDFNVTNTSKFKNGKISQGTKIGLDTLLGLLDPSTSQGLVYFLRGELGKHPTATINVAGHSLGGALTQAMAYKLKDVLGGTFPNAKVKAWVYAGPTAGGSTFASDLVNTIDEYHGFNNRLDAVPHAWQAADLNKVCTLYAQTSICNRMLENNPAVNGVVRHLRNISQNTPYTIPQHTQWFWGNAGQFDHCTAMDAVLWPIYKGGSDFACRDLDYTGLFCYPNDIYKKCTESSGYIGQTEFYGLYYFLVEMGMQHTNGYFNHFFGGMTPTFRSVVDQYVPGAKYDWSAMLEKDDGIAILEKFMKAVSDNLPAGGSCACQ